jgi:hypothetical protein
MSSMHRAVADDQYHRIKSRYSLGPGMHARIHVIKKKIILRNTDCEVKTSGKK